MLHVDKINAADFRQLITIEQRADAKDEIGGKVTTWSSFIDTWAKVSPVSGSQRTFAGKIDNPRALQIIMRFLPNITETMRVNWNGRLFDVKVVRDLDERHVYLALMCEEHVGT